MSDANGLTADGLRGIAAAISQNTEAMAAMTDALIADQEQARAEADRRFNKQARKLRRQSWGLVAVIVLLGGVVWQNSNDSSDRAERSKVAEEQRRCSDTLITNALAQLSTLATNTPNRVNGGTAIDNGALARLREDIAASMRTPDPALLVKIRDEVAAILASMQTDSPDSQNLRAGVARANEALLAVSTICYTSHPSDDPLSGKPGS